MHSLPIKCALALVAILAIACLPARSAQAAPVKKLKRRYELQADCLSGVFLGSV